MTVSDKIVEELAQENLQLSAKIIELKDRVKDLEDKNKASPIWLHFVVYSIALAIGYFLGWLAMVIF